MRVWLAGVIVLATIGFVIGTSIERRNTGHESAAQLRAEATASARTGEAGESATAHAAETGGPTTGATHKELRPLGVDIEAIPFIAVASLASLALAGLAWVRPRRLLGLLLLAVAMTAFGALDVREAFHQSDEHKTGLMILAVLIAALHLAAAALAAVMAARREALGPPGVAGTITA